MRKRKAVRLKPVIIWCGSKEESAAEKLQIFISWCKQNGMIFNDKIDVVSHGTSHRCGVLAKENIHCGEVLVQIPRKLLLNPENGKLKRQLKQFKRNLKSKGKSLKNTSGWVPLILTLMYEYKDSNSFWKPYLDLVPLPDECGHPLFWSKEERKEELHGMHLFENVEADLIKMRREYLSYALDFFIQFNEGPYTMNFKLYKQMVAFIMAYSFTENSSGPSMVPMADIFNHHSNNSAHLVYRKKHLEMVSTKDIRQGEEIFNTFGKLSNSELLQMYGFTETDENPYDTVSISLEQVLKVILRRRVSSLRLLRAKVLLLKRMGIVNDIQEELRFTTQGLKSGFDSLLTLKVLHMKKQELIKSYRRFLKDSLPPLRPLKNKLDFLSRTLATVKKTRRTRLAGHSRSSDVTGLINAAEVSAYRDKTVRHDDGNNCTDDETREFIDPPGRQTNLSDGLRTLRDNTELNLRQLDGNPRKDITGCGSGNCPNTDCKSINQSNGNGEMDSEIWLDLDNEHDQGDSNSDNDDEDSNAFLTFEQMRTSFEEEWMVTIRSCALKMQAELKEPRRTDELTHRQCMAKTVRTGQRRILNIIINSLGV